MSPSSSSTTSVTKSSLAYQAALDIKNVSKSFGDKRRQTKVLDHLSLTVAPGEFVSIVGPSGCGKSTLFQMIGGLIRPDGSGSVQMNGQDITGQRGHIAYVPQQPALFPWRTTLENIVLAQEIHGVSAAGAREAALEWMPKAGLSGFEESYPHMLSGGMQQRVAFLRGLLSPQEVMCLDEPFSALDALTREDMQRWLLDLWEKNRRTVLFITHSIEEALLLSDRIILLSGRPARVLHTVEVPFPRPRHEEITEAPDFLRLRREMTDLMREEQRKMREGGVKP